MTYSLINKCAKNYYNRTFIVPVIAKNVVTCFFLRHSVVSGSVKLSHKSEKGHPKLNERGVGKICDFQLIRHWLSKTGRTLW